MSQLFPVSQLTKALVEEKEARLKQTMRIMGLHDSVHLSAWLISSLLQFFVIAFLCQAGHERAVLHPPCPVLSHPLFP